MQRNHSSVTQWVTFLCPLVLCASASAFAQDAHHYVGTAYSADDGHVLYREEHFVFDDHGTRTRLVLYRCLSGQPFARKWVRDVGSSQAPDFDLVDARSGYREGVTGKPEAREVYTQNNGQSPKRSAPLPEHDNAVIDAGFDAYVVSHWDTLNTRHKIAFVVPSRLGYVDLSSRIEPATTTTTHIRLTVDAWYGFAAPSIDLTYNTADRQLLRFEGISNIRTAAGGSQRVRIEFPRAAIASAPSSSDVQAAAALALTNQCSP